jgi:CBS domain-containing protein
MRSEKGKTGDAFAWRRAGSVARFFFGLPSAGGLDHREAGMQVKEILRVKGNRLLTIEPAGRAADAARTMSEQNLGSLIVVDQGRLVGVLTFREILQALARRGDTLGDVRVGDIMVRDPVTAEPGMEVNDLRRTMLESGARYLPVVQDGKLLGVISFRDVAKAVLEEQDFENKMLKGYIKNWPA